MILGTIKLLSKIRFLYEFDIVASTFYHDMVSFYNLFVCIYDSNGPYNQNMGKLWLLRESHNS